MKSFTDVTILQERVKAFLLLEIAEIKEFDFTSTYSIHGCFKKKREKSTFKPPDNIHSHYVIECVSFKRSNNLRDFCGLGLLYNTAFSKTA